MCTCPAPSSARTCQQQPPRTRSASRLDATVIITMDSQPNTQGTTLLGPADTAPLWEQRIAATKPHCKQLCTTAAQQPSAQAATPSSAAAPARRGCCWATTELLPSRHNAGAAIASRQRWQVGAGCLVTSAGARGHRHVSYCRAGGVEARESLLLGRLQATMRPPSCCPAWVSSCLL